MKNGGGHFAPELGGHFELESGGHFKLELGGQYDWNLHSDKLYTPEKWKKITKAYYSNLMKDMLIPFSKLFITNKIDNIEDDEVRKMKLKEYSNSVIGDLTIYLSLIYQSGAEKQLQQTFDLLYINILEYSIGSLNNFEEYIKLLSVSSVSTYFNVSNVILLKKRLFEDFKSIENKVQYFRHTTLGICLILEKDSQKVFFKSVFNINEKLSISIKEFDKL